jgi:transcriptional regulator NrdR family protein
MAYDGIIKCPYCNYEGSDFKFLKEWTSVTAIVDRLECPSCRKIFRLYYGEKIDGTEFKYTIRMK